MRHSPYLAAMVGLLAAAFPVFGQTYPAQYQIQLAEVEVRSGPSKVCQPTSKLTKSDTVLVLRKSTEASDWLEIKPPRGSFSWINAKDVQQVDARQAIVNTDPSRPAQVLPGSTLENKPPNREGIKLMRGQIVIIVDRPLTVGNDTWLPIAPHPDEVRYIPADAVQPTPVVTTQVGSQIWNRSPDGFTTSGLMAEADEAAKKGDIARARYLYQQVSNTSTDTNQKQLAINKLANLPTGPTAPGQLTSSSKSDPLASSMTNLQQLQPAAWTAYGRLRDTRMKREDGQTIYSLEDSQGRVLTYVSTPPGKSLDIYIGRVVSVFGPTLWRPDSAVKLQFIMASHVAVP